MNVQKRLSAALLAGALALFAGNSVGAHAPVTALPVHHATSLALLSAHKIAPTLVTLHHATTSATLVHSQLTGLLGLSGSAKAQLAFNKALLSQGIKFGTSNFPGGTITGGTLTGNGFYNEVIGGSSGYSAGGPGFVTIGNTVANGSNFLTFVPNTIRGIPVFHTTLPISAALKAALQRNNNYLFGGVAAGQNSFSGKILGGELAGTAYVPFPGGYSSTANALIAFGNDPLNRTFPAFTPVNGIISGGYIRFANGVTENVSNGSLLFTNVSPTLFPFFGTSVYLPIGSNPLNTMGPFTTAKILANYLLFK